MIGLIGRKVGMTEIFDDEGALIPATIIEFEPNRVVGRRTLDRNGYEAVVLGAWPLKKSRTRKPYAGQFGEGMEPTKYLREIRNFELDCKVGDSLGVEVFEGVQRVDIAGRTKGKGYQGVIKRHGFGGGRKTHGSKFHRAPGSTGMAAWPSRVIKGSKMAGRMGGERQTVQNLTVVKVDTKNQIMLVKGAVPGPRKAPVVVTRAKKAKRS